MIDVETVNWNNHLQWNVAGRLIDLLKSREQDVINGVTKLHHSLECATRAYEDGKPEEYVVCALFHDAMGGLCPLNHGRAVAELLRPYISREHFQMLYYHERIQADNWKGIKHGDCEGPWYQMTVEFCDRFDFPSFTKTYQTMQISDFIPMIRRVINDAKPNGIGTLEEEKAADPAGGVEAVRD